MKWPERPFRDQQCLNIVKMFNIVRDVQEGGDRSIPMADSCLLMAETNTVL